MGAELSKGWRLLALAVVFVSAGCAADSTAPTGGRLSFPVAFSIRAAGGAGSAFDQADRLSVRLLRAGTTVLDTAIAFSSGGGDVRLHLNVDPSLDGVDLVLVAELRKGAAPLFTGQAAVTPSAGSGTAADVVLEPVVAAIVGPAASPTITAIGGTLALSAAAVFATGDTIPGVSITFRLLDPGIVVLTGNQVRAVAEGQARVEASSAGVTSVITVVVRPAVARVVVSPSKLVVLVKASQQLAVTLEDAAGNVLKNRVVTWASSNTSIATVDGTGKVLGVSAGNVTISAMSEGVTGGSDVTVSLFPPPPAPTNLIAAAAGTTVTLAWVDNASTETSFEVYRGPAGNARSVIATLPANVTSYRDVTLGPDEFVEYSVGACANGLCGESAVVAARTTPLAPTGLVLVVVDSATRQIHLRWTDASKAETRFEIQVFDSLSTGGWVKRAEVPADATDYDATATPGVLDRYRVLACNAAGCSGPSNIVSVQFMLAPPVAITQPSITGTDMRGFVDGYGADVDVWFEFADNPQFMDAGTTYPESLGPTGAVDYYYQLFDYPPNYKIYYRVYAQNSAGITPGNVVVLTTPDLVLEPPPYTFLCNQVSACSNPSSVILSARVTVPIGGTSPYSDVFFEEGIFPRNFLGSGTSTYVDNPSAGTRTYTYTYTFTPVNFPVGTYYVAVVGDTGPDGGTVFVGYIAFTVDVF
jgi:Bacterial Ig-like domain (group 2)